MKLTGPYDDITQQIAHLRIPRHVEHGQRADQRTPDKLERIYELAARASEAFKNIYCGPDVGKPWRIAQDLKCL